MVRRGDGSVARLGEGDDAPSLKIDRSPWVVLVTLLTGLFTVNVTVTILAVSIPRISGDLNASQSTLTWVVSGPILAFGIIGPTFGRLGDLWGQRRIFMLGLIGAAVSAVASALAWNAGSLIAFRVLAAAQGAATGPASFAIISLVFPLSQRVKALGYWAMVAAGGPVVGVVLGGPLVKALGWRAIFAIQVPLILMALLVARRVLPETPRRPNRGFDIPGAVLLAFSATPILLALNLGPARGWADPLVVLLVLASPAALVGFVMVERRSASPLVPLRYLRRRNFALPIAVQGLLNATYMGSFVLTPLLMQNLLGYDETRTGLVSTARPLSFAVAGPLAAIATTRFGERISGATGAVALVASMIWMARIDVGTSALVIAGGLALAGVAMGVSTPAMTAAMTHAVDESDLGVAGAAQQMIVQIGVTFGIQVMQTVQRTRSGVVSERASYADAYLLGGGLAAVAVVIAFGVRASPRTRRDDTESAVRAQVTVAGREFGYPDGADEAVLVPPPKLRT